MILGVNHSMRDHETNRQKKLDLVIARPTGPVPSRGESFRGLATRYGIRLTEPQQRELRTLPDIAVANVGAVLIALEAKAAMTAHQRALPRLYDELTSSHLAVHGASSQALAIAYVQINASAQFISPDLNKTPLSENEPVVNSHNQPRDAQLVLGKIAELRRRSSTTGVGFDGIGVTVLLLKNSGDRVDVVHGPPAPQEGEPFFYDSMIVRMANEYDSRFHEV